MDNLGLGAWNALDIRLTAWSNRLSQIDWFGGKTLHVIAWLIVLLVYVLRVPASWKRDVNYSVYSRVRRALAMFFNWDALLHLDPEACDNGPGWRALPLSMSFMILIVAVTFLFDGKLMLAMNAMVTFTVYTLGLFYAPKHYLVWFVRFASVHQMFTLVSSPQVFFTTGAVKRALFARSLGTFFFFSDLIEVWIHLAGYAMLLAVFKGWGDAETWLPIQHYFQFLFPTYMLGLREFICSNRIMTKSGEETKLQFMFVILVPVVAIMFSFSGWTHVSLKEGPALITLLHFSFARLLGILFAILSVACWALPKAVDGVLADQQEWDLVQELSYRSTWVFLRRAPEFMLMMSLQAIILLDARLGFVCVLLAATCFRSIRAMKSRRKDLAMFTHLIVLFGLCVKSGWTGETTARERVAHIVMASSRIVLALADRRSLAESIRDVALPSSIALLCVTDNVIIPILCFLSFASTMITVVVTQSRLHSIRMLSREAFSQAFLAHAVKQKFSAVGGSMEGFLQEGPEANTLPSEAVRVLTDARDECWQGERLCHAVNVARLIKTGMYTSKRYLCDASAALRHWQSSGALCSSTNVSFADLLSASQATPAPFVDIDWELLRLIVCAWAFRATDLRVGLEDALNGECPVLTLRRAGTVLRNLNSFGTTFSCLLNAIEGEMDQSGRYMRIKCSIQLRPSSDQAELKGLTQTKMKRTLSRRTQDIPEGLIVAVLDDNILVRKNVDRSLKRHLKVDESKSFSMGDSKEDCYKFIDSICTKEVDIAIVDQNLEFKSDSNNEEHIMGTDLAIEARKRGFKGCLLLHSAISTGLKLDSSFDGFVEKTGNRLNFCEHVLDGYYWHLDRRSSSE